MTNWAEDELDKINKFLLKEYPNELGGNHTFESLSDTVIRMLQVANTPVYKYLLLTTGQKRRPEVMADLVEALMKEMGVPMSQGDCMNSPLRISKGFLELTEAYGTKIPEVKCFKRECRPGQLMMIKPINFSSLCEHHMLPFMGQVSIGYIVSEKVIGLSKPSRLVNYFSHQLMIQERFIEQIADEIMRQTEAYAVFVKITAEHLCSKIRGTKSPEQFAVNYLDIWKDTKVKKKYWYLYDTWIKEVT